MNNTETPTTNLSDLRQLVIARRMRRQADGNLGQVSFLSQTPMWSGADVVNTVSAQIKSLRAQAADLIARADALDPCGITVGR